MILKTSENLNEPIVTCENNLWNAVVEAFMLLMKQHYSSAEEDWKTSKREHYVTISSVW